MAYANIIPMKKRYAFLFTALIAAAAHDAGAQQAQWSWALRDGNITYSVNPAYARQVLATSQDRILWGCIQNQNIIAGNMLGDYRFQELDSSGNPMVTTTLSGNISLIQARADAAGNWYILGTLHDSIKIGGGYITPGMLGSSSDHFLLRLQAHTLDPNWFTMVGSDQYCSAETFIIDGNYLYLSVDSAQGSRISQYDLTTGIRTTLIRQNTRSQVTGIARDASGGTYILGNCMSSSMMDFNGTKAAVSPLLSYPWYIVRYSADNKHKWHYFLNDISCNERSLNAAPDGGVYLSGDLLDSTTLATHHFSDSPDPDYLLARLDSNGTLSWAAQRPVASVSQGPLSFAGTGKALAADSMLILAPESQGPAIWGSGGIATNNTTMNGTVVAYGGSSGQAMWAKNINADYSSIQHIASDGSALYITGIASDLNSIGFDSVRISTTAVPGKYVPYLAKLRYRQQPPLKTAETSLAYGLYAWPNPATTTIHIYTSDRGPLRIIDMQGRKQWTGEPDRLGNINIDVATWPRGLYIVQQPSLSAGGAFKLVLR